MAVYDLIGLGFGPANISIAIALVDQWKNDAKTPIQNVLFLEKQSEFRWHPGMLLPDARMQIRRVYLKDLATLRTPTSPFTFLNYLHTHGRLSAFINRGNPVPTRKEFADYLSWCAEKVQHEGVGVRFGTEVMRLDDDTSSDGESNLIRLTVRDAATGELSTLLARDVVISPGGAPHIPRVMRNLFKSTVSVTHAPPVIHSSSYVLSIDGLLDRCTQDRPLRVAVVGGGQSAAEIVLDLRERLSQRVVPVESGAHQIDMIIRKGALRPSDDSPFTNEIFDPSSTQMWFDFGDNVRAARLREYRATNYAVVNPRTLETLYEIVYDQKVDDGAAFRGIKVSGGARLNILPYSTVIAASTRSSGEAPVRLLIHSAYGRSRAGERAYDIVVCATGYERAGWIRLLLGEGDKDAVATEISGERVLPPLASRFGLHPGIERVQLVPHIPTPPQPVSDPSSGPSSPESDELATPLSSFGDLKVLDAKLKKSEEVVRLGITRNYCLIPATSVASSKRESRVYLQGVEETTHGLSDSLLSVMSVRAGEVVGDMLNGY
ncbi:hypothetical protein FISHEDRAFT_53392 [Fistulina hepatica ATCC 64428]|nr:hypothetical protein FISHEDRAFT_53392 [Fistulina hepatica ATCC 64428]